MALKQFTTDFKSIGNQEFLRPNVGYRYFFDIKKSMVFKNPITTQLKYILKPLLSNKIPKGELDSREILVDLANIERRYNSLVNLEEVNQIGSDKNILNFGDIVIPKIQPQMGNIFLNTDHTRYVASTELLEYTVCQDHNPVFVYYLITSKQFLADLERLEGGKTHRRVNPTDLLKIRIPTLSKRHQDQVVTEIEPIAIKIQALKTDIKPQQEIIDKVFVREFKFNKANFDQLSKIKMYETTFSEFANNIDVRYSVKFHRNAGAFVLAELKKVTNKKIKHFIAEPIVLGTSVSPSDYDENGDYYYISMANIKNWKFENDDAKLVSNEYSKKNQNKTIALNDILIARSGEGTIGKVALIEDEELLGIFADFTMRIKLKDYNPTFAYYYFRTTYFQYLIEINKKGLGNNTNIFPSQIQELPMMDIPLARQEKIVQEIKKELEEQNVIRSSIEQERAKIDEIIEKAIQ